MVFILKIAKFIVGDLQPYSVVDGAHFREMIQFADEKFSVPSSTYFRNAVVPNLMKFVREKIKNVLDERVDFCCADIDIWSSSAQHSYLSLSVHYVDKLLMVRKHCVLGLRHVPENHNADYISQMLWELLKEWNLMDKMHLFFRDNALNMVKGIEKLGIAHAGDYDHKLNLVAQHACESQRNVMEMFARSQSIVGHFRHSTTDNHKLFDLQKQLKIYSDDKPRKLIQAGNTRWNSHFDMVERLLEQKDAIVILQQRLKLPKTLTENDWKIMQSVCKLLKPVKIISLRAQRRDCCISECIPLTK